MTERDLLPTAKVSVLLPTFNQAAFLRRALDSLRAQTFTDWELIVVDDGSTDETTELLAALRDDARVRVRVRVHRFAENRGLGAALNAAMDDARGEYVAYLPSDDLYHAEHLASLVASLDGEPGAVLAHSGVRYRYNKIAETSPPGEALQLVQAMHRRTDDRWTERDELTTDDLERMFWAKLRARGAFVGTGRATCEWVEHPHQRHKAIRETPAGGVNTYRDRYGVRTPLVFQSTQGNFIDEREQYRHYRERPDTAPAPVSEGGLKILLVGELAYNPDRVLALEERGHRLYGLWMPRPMWFNAVGPQPFGHVTDLPRDGWQAAVRDLKPDIIYALLNWQTVAFAHHVLTENPGIPFVWHFKEGPFICLEKGIWRELVDLTTRSDGQIYSSPELRDWFETVVPGVTKNSPQMILDGDLPKRDWFAGERSRRLSEDDGEIHTVVPGRPIGIHVQTLGELAAAGVHLHFYGDVMHGQWREWIERAEKVAPDKLHLHANVDQRGWLREFSKYDAGWLHYFASDNGGDPRRANWDDLNYPARIATLAVAGLPLLQYDNGGAFVAADALARTHDLGFFGRSMAELAAQLGDRARLDAVRESVWRQRDLFTFDAHADELIAFFRKVIGG